jgi:hypothetical protein
VLRNALIPPRSFISEGLQHKREVAKLKAEREIFKKAAVDSTGERNMICFMSLLKDSRCRRWVGRDFPRSRKRALGEKAVAERYWASGADPN